MNEFLTGPGLQMLVGNFLSMYLMRHMHRTFYESKAFAELALGLATGVIHGSMEMKTRYDAITPQVSLIMNMTEILIVLGLCRFGNKDKDGRYNKITKAFMIALLQEGKADEARRCLEERMAQEPHAAARYCDNTTVNAAITYYVDLASRKHIPIKVSANIPSGLRVDEMQLAIAISNLLEISNTFDGKVKTDEEGYPVAREEGHGTGTRSVLAFVHQTESEIRYMFDDRLFTVQMII